MQERKRMRNPQQLVKGIELQETLVEVDKKDAMQKVNTGVLIRGNGFELSNIPSMVD